MNSMLGFVELGLIILAWSLVWNFILKGWAGNHASHPAAQGLAAVYTA